MTETQGNQERSVPKPVFTDAEAGAKTFPDSTKRDYNYFTPARRKQTRYEDVTVEVQPDPRHYLSQGWLYGFSDGRGHVHEEVEVDRADAPTDDVKQHRRKRHQSDQH